MHLVLALLDGESHGYALIKRVEDISDGAVKMGPGTLYGTLNRLLADGLIVETANSTDDRRRNYQLTDAGEHVARAELARLRHLLTRLNALRGPATA
jgi:DNA-binding PadR family transcriptional regulator